MMLTLLTLLHGSSDSIDVLRSASVLQGALDAELIVAHPQAETDIPMVVGDGSFVLFDDGRDVASAAQSARHAYDAVCADKANCRFRDTRMPPADCLRKQALFADMVVLARDQAMAEAAFALLKAALVAYRMPTVFLPVAALDAAPATVVVSWNGQAPAARAIRAALPFLRTASRLIVLEHAGTDVNRSRLEHFLAANGIEPADWRQYGDASLTARGRARALLAEAAAEGADLLVMGAYGDADEGFFRFGRATEKVASAAKIPVLFSA